ncbi:hypothetical protein O9H85_23835 [Paenibacillus filicis]|uniref:ATP-binding protein n=1 Tax=Paenibacillus gyeongsangnamensis TaxID=3388067 RepID=A0ABT4QEV2_9BACL|nr:hypothetical protein [Paenibacillus filicis]MCZ8515386.1 hypothetical protein [Paenibacillus filicis]
MGNLKEALLIERSRLFVGRQAEIAYVNKWLSKPNAPTEAVFVSGMGGIGKSALLLKFLDMAQDAGAQCLWLDSRVCKDSPSGFLDVVHSLLMKHTVSESAFKDPMTEIMEMIASRRTVLCIDNYEALNSIEGWLREVFLPELPATEAFIVLAGRQPLSLEWQNDIAWRSRLRIMHLEPLSRMEMWNYYSNLGLEDTEAIETLIQDTHGHPLAMALAAENVNRTERSEKSGAWPVSRVVSAQLLREVVSPDFHEILDLLTILPQANQDTLNRLLSAPLKITQLHQLSQLSFIRPTMEGFALHDVAREHLLSDFQSREPERFQTLRRRIVEDSCTLFRTVKPHEKNGIAAALLSICKDALPNGFYGNNVPASFDMYRKVDLPYLHKLLVEERAQQAISLESEEKAHQLLDELAERFPESIRVFRSNEDIPIMFHAGLLLYQDTFSFLQAYIPSVLEACFPDEAGRISLLRHEEAETYYHFLGGVAADDLNYTPKQLFELMFTDGFSRIVSMGTRLTLTTNSDNLKAKFQSLGFQTRWLRHLPSDHPAHGDTVLELDLRTRDFGAWVVSFLDASAVEHRPVPSDAMLQPEDLKAALLVLDDPDALGRTAVARWLNRSGSEVQSMLSGLLRSAQPPSPLSRRNQNLLHLLHAHPSLSPDAAASRLHVSRATYYRHLSETMDKTITLLGRYRN